MIKVFCNRCGKEVTKCKSHGYIALNTRDVKESSLIEDNEFENNQYCSSCMKQIREFIKTAPDKVVEEENNKESCQNSEKSHENEEKCAENEKKRIDVGKILALKKAGWKNKDIASEMHLSSQTVTNVIYQHKSKTTESGAVMIPIQKQERSKL